MTTICPDVTIADLLADLLGPAPFRVTAGPYWLSAHPAAVTDLPAQGWKLHVSARPGTLATTLERVVPVLVEADCPFKVIAGTDRLQAQNAGLLGLGAVGKAITAYPAPARLVALAERLAARLRGLRAPRINSDRRVHADAPVYYRFGPISPRFRLDGEGRVQAVVLAPDGTAVPGTAGDRVEIPPWVVDPFTSGPAAVPGAPPRLGGRYRPVSGIARSARGISVRAVDERGRPVVVKQAKAFVAEDLRGRDARTYLRNERRVLEALAGVPGVPELVDHFRHGEDEYLVTSDLGGPDLRRDVLDAGVFGTDGPPGRDALVLAGELLRLLDAIHERGVVHRDLAPKNVVVTHDGWGLVDFELSSLAGEQQFGWTPGYSHPRQRADRPALPADDHYGLGATLFYALTGFDPVALGDDHTIAVSRTIAGLHAVVGRDAPVASLIAGLLAGPGGHQARALRDLRAGRSTPMRTRHLGAAIDVDVDVDVERILVATRARVRHAAEVLCRSQGLDHGVPVPTNAYLGTAGIGAELAHHDGCGDVVHGLAAITARLTEHLPPPPGLLFGAMGTALFLHATARATGDPDLDAAAARLRATAGDPEGPPRSDVVGGLAGTLIGHLAIGHPDADAVARALIALPPHRPHDGLPPADPRHGTDLAHGFGHGSAGVAYALLAYAVRMGDSAARARGEELADAVVARVRPLVRLAGRPRARPMCGSWCQGLSGIGTMLVRAAGMLDDARLLDAAEQAAAGCRSIAPRVPLTSQCCGLAGIGELFVDLHALTGDPRHIAHARGILDLIVRRSAGPVDDPCVPDNTLRAESPAWATGTAGVLSFVRRLHDPTSPRLWMVDDGPDPVAESRR